MIYKNHEIKPADYFGKDFLIYLNNEVVKFCSSIDEAKKFIDEKTQKQILHWVDANNGNVRFCINYHTLQDRKHRTVKTVKGIVKVLKEFDTVPGEAWTLAKDVEAHTLYKKGLSIYLDSCVNKIKFI
tara:strand:- start:120 stop:503 length:384 start_codon:yes stop_codon:yes gene_type:complete